MTDHGRGADDHAETEASSVLVRDARILKRALRKAVQTSPGSFLRTEEDLAAHPFDYWVNEVRSATWAIMQRGEEVVGLVAGRLPDSSQDAEDQRVTRYIESVWIAPELRNQGLGTRLIHYLLEAECRKNRRIRQFLLWVFTSNASAISLYERLGFKPTAESKPVAQTKMTEVKYRLDFDAALHAAVGWAEHEAARLRDRRQYGITYRLLGEYAAG